MSVTFDDILRAHLHGTPTPEADTEPEPQPRDPDLGYRSPRMHEQAVPLNAQIRNRWRRRSGW